MNDTPIGRGDVVELNASCAENFSAKEKSLARLTPDNLVVLRKLEDGNLLVALCRNQSTNRTVCLQTSLTPIYAYIKQFYSVSPQHVLKSPQKLFSPYCAVSEIYTEHNKWIDENKSKREKKRQKKAEKIEKAKNKAKARKRAIIAKRKAEEHYEKLYEISAMNNDKKQMQEIIEKVGYVPYRGKGGTSISQIKKSSQIHFNPKPLNGGRFSPK